MIMSSSAYERSLARSGVFRRRLVRASYRRTDVNKALLGSIVAAGLGLVSALSVGAPTPEGSLPPPADQTFGRAVLKELVEINSTHSFGSTEVARAIGRRLL